MLTQERLRELVHYDPVVGVFIRKKNGVGKIVTDKDGKGYGRISLEMKRYASHRVAWFYMTGEWPPEEIDHINGIKTDNSFANLRLASSKQNKRNTKKYKNNTSGFKGVRWHTCSKRWQARFYKGGREVNLGLYDTPEEAHAAYVKASVEHFGEFARINT